MRLLRYHPPTMTADMIKDILGKLLQFLGLPFDAVEVSEEKDSITRVDIKTSNASRLIGWHGETLSSVQHILKSIIRSKEHLERTPFIILDVDGYLREQEEKVTRIADQKADFVRRTGSRIALAPMSPYFRRIVHLYVASNPNLTDLTTESVGEGEYRQIVLKLKEEKEGQGEELSPVFSKEDGLENLDI